MNAGWFISGGNHCHLLQKELDRQEKNEKKNAALDTRLDSSNSLTRQWENSATQSSQQAGDSLQDLTNEKLWGHSLSKSDVCLPDFSHKCVYFWRL
jgi:hypothetical protein